MSSSCENWTPGCVQEPDPVDSSRSTARYRVPSGAPATQATGPPSQPSPVVVTLQYFGSHLDLTRRWLDTRDDVLIEQQPSGANTVYVFRDRISPGGPCVRVQS